MYSFYELALGQGGVASCKSCVSPRSEAYPAAEILSKIGSHKEIMLAGFEPFAHPELVSLLQSPELVRVERLGMRTDSGALASPQNAAGVLASGVRFFEIVLLGSSALAHEGLTRRPGLFESAKSGARKLRRVAEEQGHEIFITGLAPICRHNEDDLLGLVSTFVELEVDAIRFESSRALNQELIDAAYEIAIPAGILLFGDSCNHIESATLYHFEAVE